MYARAAMAEPAIANEIVGEIELGDDHQHIFSTPLSNTPRQHSTRTRGASSSQVKYSSLPAPLGMDDDEAGGGEGALSRAEVEELFSPATIEKYRDATQVTSCPARSLLVANLTVYILIIFYLHSICPITTFSPPPRPPAPEGD